MGTKFLLFSSINLKQTNTHSVDCSSLLVPRDEMLAAFEATVMSDVEENVWHVEGIVCVSRRYIAVFSGLSGGVENVKEHLLCCVEGNDC